MTNVAWLGWLLLASWAVGGAQGHGRLIDPPSRASAWRFGFDTPKDYNDNEGFCGGYNYQYQVQGGRCGICGDAWDQDPRAHEVGGPYATGTLVRHYTEGQVVPVRVEITSNHRGHFEFRICPTNDPHVEASQTCLNEHPLFQADGAGFEYKVPSYNGEHVVYLQLPSGLTCSHCVVQWRYVAGNNWGTCADGTGGLGCGPQEEFRACADVRVNSESFVLSTGSTNSSSTGEVTSSYSWYSTPTPILTPTLSPTEQPPPTLPRSSTVTAFSTRKTSRRPRPTTRKTTRQRPTTSPFISTTTPKSETGCKAVGAWQRVPGMDEWCERNCNHVPSYCPPTHCKCG